MSKKISACFIVLLIITSTLSITHPAYAGALSYCDFVNWLRQQSLKRVSSRGTSYTIPASHINKVGWQGFLALASETFTPKQINYFLNELDQMGRIEFDGQEITFWDNDPDFCPPGGKPAGEEFQPNPSGSPNLDPAKILPWVLLGSALLFVGLSRLRREKQSEAFGGN